MSSRRWLLAAALITTFSLATFFIGLGIPALWDRDEPSYASAALEMRANNDWLTPTIEGEAFLEKPILMYWLVLASYRSLGVDEFSSRLPSAIFGLLTCFTIFFTARALWGYEAGVYSAIVFSTSLLAIVVSRLLVPDAALTFFTATAFAFYLHSKTTPERERLFLGLSYGAIGVGILSKGPVALFPAVVFLLYDRITATPVRGRAFARLARRHVYFSTLAFAISAPWFAYAFYTHDEFMSRFFLHDNLGRFATALQGHSGGVMYYIPVLLIGMFPWSCFLVASLVTDGKSGRWRRDAGVLLLLLWLVVPFIVLSLTATKLPHYLLIAFPALACLTGKFLPNAERQDRLFVAAVVATALSSCLITAALVLTHFIAPRYAPWAALAPFLGLSGFMILGIAWSRKGRLRHVAILSTVAFAAFFVALSLISLPYVEGLRVMRPIALAVKHAAGERAEVYRYAVSEPSLVFYSGRYFSPVRKGELDEILSRPALVYIVTRKDKLLQAQPKSAYTIVAEKNGFSENGGPMTLLLISNGRQ